jgi:hypothetical protein
LPKNKKKQSWKEIQRERQLKQQRAQEGERIRLEVDRKYKNGHKGYPKGKIFVAVCLIAVIFVGYVALQQSNSANVNELPPTIPSGTTKPPTTTTPAPSFSLRDVNGTLFSLNQHSGQVIAIHFMAVGCHGQIYPINDYQLQQLETVCSSFCSSESVTAVTVAVATCENSDLALIKVNHGVTWCLGNDYDDGKMDIIDAYAKYSIQDGTIILVDKKSNVAQVYTDAITANALSSKINQLLMA